MLEAEDKSFITLNAAEGAGRSAWVLGLGASGRAAAQYLNDHGWRVHAFDTREAPAGLDAFYKAVPGCEMTLGGFPETTAPGVELVVMSPGVFALLWCGSLRLCFSAQSGHSYRRRD